MNFVERGSHCPGCIHNGVFVECSVYEQYSDHGKHWFIHPITIDGRELIECDFCLGVTDYHEELDEWSPTMVE